MIQQEPHMTHHPDREADRREADRREADRAASQAPPGDAGGPPGNVPDDMPLPPDPRLHIAGSPPAGRVPAPAPGDTAGALPDELPPEALASGGPPAPRHPSP